MRAELKTIRLYSARSIRGLEFQTLDFGIEFGAAPARDSLPSQYWTKVQYTAFRVFDTKSSCKVQGCARQEYLDKLASLWPNNGKIAELEGERN